MNNVSQETESVIFDKAYLEGLIANQVEEHPELEYKAAKALLREDKKVAELTKDVSAFANSNGGILIYGISEDPVNRNLPGKIDPVDRQLIGKEWLEQILNGRIKPRIHGLKIHVVSYDENQAVYILEVPKGDTAHQADDKRYYRRHNFTVEPLFDHEIRDIMGRQKDAEVILDFVIRRQKNSSQAAEGSQLTEPYLYWLDIYAYNIGRVLAKYVNILLEVPKKCLRGNNHRQTEQGMEKIKVSNAVRDLVAPDASRYYTGQFAKAPQYGPVRYDPILPGMDMLLQSIALHEYCADDGNQFSWTVYVDNAVPKSDSIKFEKIKRT